MATPQERINTVASGKTIDPKIPPAPPVNMDALKTALKARMSSHWLAGLDGLRASPDVAVPGLGMFKNAAALRAAFPGEIAEYGIGFHFYARGLIGCTVSYFAAQGGILRVMGSMSDEGNYAHVASAVVYANLGLATAALDADITLLETLCADVNEAGRPQL